MAAPTPPRQSSESAVSEPKPVVHQQPTPPRTPSETQASPTTTEVRTREGKTILVTQGGQLYETHMDSDD